MVVCIFFWFSLWLSSWLAVCIYVNIQLEVGWICWITKVLNGFYLILKKVVADDNFSTSSKWYCRCFILLIWIIISWEEMVDFILCIFLCLRCKFNVLSTKAAYINNDKLSHRIMFALSFLIGRWNFEEKIDEWTLSNHLGIDSACSKHCFVIRLNGTHTRVNIISKVVCAGHTPALLFIP